MSRDTRLSTAIHILILLSGTRDKLLQSDYIASSVNTNPVVIRRLIGLLRDGKLVEVVAGKNGGTRIAKSPDKITALDVFNAVQNTPTFYENSNTPNPKCPVGASINTCLTGFYEEVQDTLNDKLASETISSLYLRTQEKCTT